jgi:hypothetical protein
VRRQHAAVGAGVDHHARAVAPARRLDQQPIALTDVERRQPQRGRRRRRQP